MNEQIISQLKQLNFSLNEAKVYEALLSIGQTSAGGIIKRTQLHRSVVYETLDKLIDKKFVIKIDKEKIAFYQVTDPSRILQNIKSQEEIALNLLPKLKDLIDSKLPEIVVYEGIESYRRFWIDSIKNTQIGSTDYVAGSMGSKFMELMGETYVEKYLKGLSDKKIKLQMVVFTKDPWELSLLKKHPKIMDFRLIEKGKVGEGNFNIWGDTVILQSGTEPVIIEIKNPTLVRVFKNLFDLLWSMGKRL